MHKEDYQPTVYFTKEESDEILKIGYSRNKTNRDGRNGDAVVHLALSKERDLVGAASEKAVQKFFNCEWVGKLFPIEEWRRVKDKITDVSNLEVKGSIHRAGRLFIPEYQFTSNRVKLKTPYVFVKPSGMRSRQSGPIIEFTGGTLKGWAYGEEIVNPKFLEDYGKPCFFLPNSLLRTIKSLVDLLSTT